MARKKEPDLFERNRNKITEVAKELFLVRGIENTKMEDIAKVSKMSKSTLYVYFKNKEEVIWSMSLEAMRFLRDELSDKTTSGNMSFREKYFAIGHVFESMKEKYPLSFSLISRPIEVADEALKENVVLMEIYEAGEQINNLIYSCFSTLNSQMDKQQLFRFVFRQWGCIYGLIELTWNKQDYLYKSIGMTRSEYLDMSFEDMYKELSKSYSI